jgi:pathogenesis-related protein 1
LQTSRERRSSRLINLTIALIALNASGTLALQSLLRSFIFKMKITTKIVLALFLLAAFVSAAVAQKGKAKKTETVKPKKVEAVKTSGKLCPGANGLTATEIDGILDAHNNARADVGLPKIKWSCKLADFAQEWAKRGIFEHRTGSVYGENIFVAADTNALPAGGVRFWLTEKSFWNNSTAACRSGKVCTHYTQIVWKKTTEVGCGINRSASGKWKLMLVCNYNPAGNFPAGKAF